MPNRWSSVKAEEFKTDLEIRAYSSQLIGTDSTMVLHGGGNTSVKSQVTNRFGEDIDVIWVKASGFDLQHMWTEGFTAVRLDPLLHLAELEMLSDSDMANDVNCARLNSEAAAPSIETIVHAIVPYKFVDHTHSDAILTISNSKNATNNFNKIYGDRVLVLPYVKPGFDLAVQFKEVLQRNKISEFEAIILEHHGVFTFGNSAKESYENMVQVVDLAERFLLDNFGEKVSSVGIDQDLMNISLARRVASDIAGKALLSFPGDQFPVSLYQTLGTMSQNGTLTPEHVIHVKPFPALVGEDVRSDMTAFSKNYTDYFAAANDNKLKMLSPHPHWALFESGHVRAFAANIKRCGVARDVANANLRALRYATDLGGWQGLSREDQRALEYWDLEQEKLRRQKPDRELAGKVAIVTGAAAGIGRATAELLLDSGAVVVGFDINPEVRNVIEHVGYLGLTLDLTKETDLKVAGESVIRKFGGLDIVVSNAGIFKTGRPVEELEQTVWDETLKVNLTSHQLLVKHTIPFLKNGIDSNIVFIGSRNVKAPGAGAAAYSVSKAGLTQLMRVLALELGQFGITVNAIHPDAVFDTKLWTDEALKSSADRYGLTIDQYKKRNLLKCEIRSHDVGLAVVAFVNGALSKTTGAQLAVDGGNERVI